MRSLIYEFNYQEGSYKTRCHVYCLDILETPGGSIVTYSLDYYDVNGCPQFYDFVMPGIMSHSHAILICSFLIFNNYKKHPNL